MAPTRSEELTDELGWMRPLPGADHWHLVVNDASDGPEVWRSARDCKWRARIWRGGVCVWTTAAYDEKLEAQEAALEECLKIGMPLLR